MEIKFQNEAKKDLWEKFKASKIGDSFSEQIIKFAESLMINMQEEIEKQGEMVLIEPNFDALEKKICEKEYSSIEDFQEALDRTKLYETDFQWIIKKSMKLAQPQNINKDQKECAINFISYYWQYGKMFKQAVERTKIAEKLIEERENPVMHLSPKAKKGL